MRRQFEKEYRELQTNGLKSNPLRLEYERKVRELACVRDSLFAEGYTAEEIARMLHRRRRELGVIYKDSAPPLFREYIWYATAQKYGDPLGPDYDSLRSRKTPEEIIESASRPIDDLNNRLTIHGFRQWFENVYEPTDSIYIKEGATMNFDTAQLRWTREPAAYSIAPDRIEIVTAPHTDLWQRTYYHFRNDNAPVLQLETDERYFSFEVKTAFDSRHRFDQCGIVMYLDSENWLKASIEYENETIQHLGSVVTNMGYSDWATTAIDGSLKSMWYRFSRREDDYRIECSTDGIHYSQMRICHMHKGGGTIRFGIYACSPEDSSFKAVFTNMRMTECKWLPHDGQKPDED